VITLVLSIFTGVLPGPARGVNGTLAHSEDTGGDGDGAAALRGAGRRGLPRCGARDFGLWRRTGRNTRTFLKEKRPPRWKRKISRIEGTGFGNWFRRPLLELTRVTTAETGFVPCADPARDPFAVRIDSGSYVLSPFWYFSCWRKKRESLGTERCNFFRLRGARK